MVHELVQHISTGGGQVYPFRCDHWSCDTQISSTYSTEGGSEKEVNLSFKFYSIKVCNLCYLA